MKKALFRIAALAVALAFPTGVFAQSATPKPTEKATSSETKSSTNPVTGSQSTTTETKSSTKTATGKTTALRFFPRAGA